MRFTFTTAAALIALTTGQGTLGSPAQAPINLHGPAVSCPGFNSFTVEPLTEQGKGTFYLNNTLLSTLSWTDRAWFDVPLPADLSGTNRVRVDFPAGPSISRPLIVLPGGKASTDRFPQVRTALEPPALQKTRQFHPTIPNAYLESFVCTSPRRLVGFIRDDSRRVEDIATFHQYQGQWILIDYSPVEKH